MAGYIVVMKFTRRHWLALAPSNLQSSRTFYLGPVPTYKILGIDGSDGAAGTI